MEVDFERLKVQGVKINYYYICKRKLWLFDKGITMEQNSDRVLTGKIVHQNSYSRAKSKEVTVDNILKMDIIDGDYVKETKISSRMPKADRMQLLYYLYYLKRMGINKKGTINYVKEKRKENVQLTPEDEMQIEEALLGIRELSMQKSPPKLQKLRICTKCAYYEFCFVKEE